ncbi:MAG: 2-hydroxychromene-2-carboxylate isomerase, partial [Alphaproteobacteria bacterium]
MTKPTMDFWYEFASPYACLTALRIEDLAEAAGVEVIWRPFLLGAIYKMMELPAPPMQLCPQKEAYMWLDAKRQAGLYGFPFKAPSQFPRVAVLAARVALVGRGQGWCPEFSKAVYKANFADDLEIAKVEIIAGILERIGLDPVTTIEKAQTPE